MDFNKNKQIITDGENDNSNVKKLTRMWHHRIDIEVSTQDLQSLSNVPISDEMCGSESEKKIMYGFLFLENNFKLDNDKLFKTNFIYMNDETGVAKFEVFNEDTNAFEKAGFVTYNVRSGNYYYFEDENLSISEIIILVEEADAIGGFDKKVFKAKRYVGIQLEEADADNFCVVDIAEKETTYIYFGKYDLVPINGETFVKIKPFDMEKPIWIKEWSTVHEKYQSRFRSFVIFKSWHKNHELLHNLSVGRYDVWKLKDFLEKREIEMKQKLLISKKEKKYEQYNKSNV